jgi:hypothetical protein
MQELTGNEQGRLAMSFIRIKGAAEYVMWVLNQVVAWRGRPLVIRLDNGSEPIVERVMTGVMTVGLCYGTFNRGKRIREH